MKIPKKIKEMARKCGYHDVRCIGKYKDCKVYMPIYTDGETHCTGYPQYILSNGREARWPRDWEESMDIMTHAGQPHIKEASIHQPINTHTK